MGPIMGEAQSNQVRCARAHLSTVSPNTRYVLYAGLCVVRGTEVGGGKRWSALMLFCSLLSACVVRTLGQAFPFFRISAVAKPTEKYSVVVRDA